MGQGELLALVVEFLTRQGVPYAIVGSMGAMVFGESRYTHDIDILVDINESDIPEFLGAFTGEDWYISRSAMIDALRRRGQFNVIHHPTGHKVDFIIPARTGWQAREIDRRIEVQLTPELRGYAGHPNDIITGKLMYHAEGGSDKHLRDIAAMLTLNSPLIDRAEIAERAAEMGAHEAWEVVLKRVAEMPPPPPDFSF